MRNSPIRSALLGIAAFLLLGSILVRQSRAEPEAGTVADDSRADVLFAVFRAEKSMLSIRCTMLTQLTEASRPILPDDFAKSPKEHQEKFVGWQRSSLRFEGGMSIRHYYLYLRDSEFRALMQDPFGGGLPYRYSVSPGKLEWILASNGPDGDVDIDISTFDLSIPGRGLPEAVGQLIYDPTNGIVSNGDILAPGGNRFLEMIRTGEAVANLACCD